MKFTNTYTPWIYMSSQYVFLKSVVALYYNDVALLIHVLLK